MCLPCWTGRQRQHREALPSRDRGRAPTREPASKRDRRQSRQEGRLPRHDARAAVSSGSPTTHEARTSHRRHGRRRRLDRRAAPARAACVLDEVSLGGRHPALTRRQRWGASPIDVTRVPSHVGSAIVGFMGPPVNFRLTLPTIPDGWVCRWGSAAARLPPLTFPSYALGRVGADAGLRGRSGAMSVLTTPPGARSADVEIRPLRFDVPQSRLDDMRRRIEADELARTGDGHGSIARRAACDGPGPRAPLADGLRLAGRARRGSTHCRIHHRDRRARHPFHPRPFQDTRTRCRSSSITVGPDRSSSSSRSSIDSPTRRPMAEVRRTPSRRHSVDAGLWLLGEADATAGARADGPSVERADAPPRLHRYVAQGGDWGAFVVDQMGRRRRRDCSRSTQTCRRWFRLRSMTPLSRGDPPPAGLSADERRACEQLIRTSSSRSNTRG